MILWLLACTPLDTTRGSTQIGTEGGPFCSSEIVDVDDAAIPASGLDFAGTVLEEQTAFIAGSLTVPKSPEPHRLEIELTPSGPLQVERDVAGPGVEGCDQIQYLQSVEGMLRVSEDGELEFDLLVSGTTDASEADAVGLDVFANDPAGGQIQLLGRQIDGVWMGVLGRVPAGGTLGEWTED